MERFGMVALGVAFHASKTEDRPKEVLGEPTLADLAREAREKRFDFAAADRFVERHENVRGTEVPVVFRDLVFEDEVIPERVPRELGDQPMILVKVVPIMSEYEIRGHGTLEVLERLLDQPPLIRQEAVSELLRFDARAASAPQERLRALERLPLAGRVGREDDPGERRGIRIVDQPEHRPA